MCYMVVCCCCFLDKWSCILRHLAVCLFPIPSLRMAHFNFYSMLHWLRSGFIFLRCNRVSSIASGFILLASLVLRVGSSLCGIKGGNNGRKSLMKFCYGENDLSSNRERHFVLSSNFLAAIGLPQSLLALVLLLSEGEGLHTYAVSRVITQEKKILENST